MAVSGFKDLTEHVGHTLEVVTYGNPSENVAIECLTCCEVLLSYDEEEED